MNDTQRSSESIASEICGLGKYGEDCPRCLRAKEAIDAERRRVEELDDQLKITISNQLMYRQKCDQYKSMFDWAYKNLQKLLSSADQVLAEALKPYKEHNATIMLEADMNLKKIVDEIRAEENPKV